MFGPIRRDSPLQAHEQMVYPADTRPVEDHLLRMGVAALAIILSLGIVAARAAGRACCGSNVRPVEPA
jgi:hypothetical protein